MNDQRIDVIWPNEKLQSVGIRSGWRKNWSERKSECKEGMVGYVVGCLSPNHNASNENQNILLVNIDGMCVPITERGVKEYRSFTSPKADQEPKNQTADDPEPESKDEEQVTL